MKKLLLTCIFIAGAISMIGWALAQDNPLFEAVRNSEHDTIKNLLRAHANPNALLPDKSTVLSWAVDRQDLETVRLLLHAGAKPNVTDITGGSPLTLACELGDAGIVSELVKAGANPKAKRPDGISALALCAGHSSAQALQSLLAKGADSNGADPHGQTPLMWAAANGRVDNITILLKHGASVNAVTKKGFTALLFALKSKVAEAPIVLLDAGADSGAVLPDGTSVVEAAVEENNIPFAMLLVSHGADIARRDAEGRQLIHIAASSGNFEFVKLVLSKGGDPNALSEPPGLESAHATLPSVTNSNGPSKALAVADGSTVATAPAAVATPPLIFAARAGSVESMKALIEAGARPDLKAQDGTTLALAAASSDNLAALKFALQFDPDIYATAQGGRSIMHMAVANREGPETEAVIQYLADKGAKLDAKDDHGVTPGDFLNRGGSPESIRVFYIQLLRDHGIVSIAH